MASADEAGVINQEGEPIVLRGIDWLGVQAALCAGLICMMMAVHIGADVFMRSVFSQPIDGTLDVATFGYMPAIVFLGMAATERLRQHITVSLVRDSMSGEWVPRHDLAAGILSSVAVAILLYGSFLRALHSVEIGETVVGSVDVPVWPATIVMTIGLLIFLLQAAASTIRSWARIRTMRSQRA